MRFTPWFWYSVLGIGFSWLVSRHTTLSIEETLLYLTFVIVVGVAVSHYNHVKEISDLKVMTGFLYKCVKQIEEMIFNEDEDETDE